MPKHTQPAYPRTAPRRARALILALPLATSLLAGLTGCQREPAHTPNATASAATEPLSAPRAEPASIAAPGSDVDLVVLDRRDDGAVLRGVLVAPIPHADPERRMALRAEGLDLAIEVTDVLDARFIEGGVVTLDASHVLRAHRPGRTDTLDVGVYGPLSVMGHQLAYVRGAPPVLEVARVDVDTGVAQAVTQAMAPCWSPALAPDGSIVFASAASGSPRVYRAGAGAPTELTGLLGRFPDAVTAPRVEGNLYVFDDPQGTVWADLATGEVVRTAGGTR